MTSATAQQTDRLRVLVIGAGRRVQNNFLPALACLKKEFEVVGIHARTSERMMPVSQQWGVPAVADLATFDMAQVDVVAISVPTDQNAHVLRQLMPYAAHLRIIIDTPIFRNSRELAAVNALLPGFKEVYAAEDFMNFPPYQLLRQVVDEGLIGSPRRLALLNTGYLYHGLALIRSFVGFASVLRSHASGGFANRVCFAFRNGFRACIVGPYRQYEHGGVVLEGTLGMISEVSGDVEFRPVQGRAMYTLVKQHEAGVLMRYALMHRGEVVRVLEVPDYASMHAMAFEDKSELNLLRGCGLIQIFRSLYSSNINNRYGVKNALYDSMISRLAERGRFPFDPLALFGGSAMNIICALARLRAKY